jgi:ATP-dependent DNA helicase RecG
LNSAMTAPFHATPVTSFKGVGPRNAERLQRVGVVSVQDLLLHLPLRYEDRTRVTPIGALQPGDQALVEAAVEHCEVRLGRRRSLLVSVADESGALLLRFFHFSAAQQANLQPGVRLRCYGEVRRGPNSLELVHPEYKHLGEEVEVAEQALTPIYPTTEGMHQLTWRALTAQALALLQAQPERLREGLPAEILQDLALPPLAPALQLLHRPPPDVDRSALVNGAHPAQLRLAFEELVAHQISLRRLRRKHQAITAPRLQGDGVLRRGLLAALAFQPTSAQQRVAAEIAHDLAAVRPMLRMVQGDVGSGKTLVAALAALQCIEAGEQVALMAPTELLAEQHWRNFSAWLEPLGIGIAWLTGRQKARQRQVTLQAIAVGQARLAIGTHALFQADVEFQSLGLVIIDEQHRFGVHQRLALREKGAAGAGSPHQLIMTATPIPRSLAMTAYADLDLSVIDELPPGRTPVTTVALPDSRREEVMERVRLACASGRQAYWVCTLIEDSEALQCQAAEETAQQLRETLRGIAVGLVHGRMKSAEREQVMADFKAGRLGLLVATTVIEVGVDVPNASLMIIENPERLGLAQLHQLRGRVGRGTAESHCLLMYHAPLSAHARERLAILRDTTDGFLISQRDLELRGPGEVLGTRQTGEMQFRVADLVRHQGLLDEAQRTADLMLKRFPQQAQTLEANWLGSREDYGHV